MISFQQPWMLLWLLSLGVPILLWLYRRKALRKKSSAPWFYFKTSELFQKRSRWQRWMQNLAFWFAVLSIVWMSMVLAQPKWEAHVNASAPRSVTFLFDTSASMAAKDAETQALEKAKSSSLKILHQLNAKVPVTLVSLNADAEILTSSSLDRAYLQQLIHSLQPKGLGASQSLTQDLLKRYLSHPSEDHESFFFTDQPEFATGHDARLKWVSVGSSQGVNLGITQLEVLRNPLQPRASPVKITVRASSSQAEKTLKTTLRIWLDRRPVAIRSLTMKSDEEQTLDLNVDLSRAKLLKASLQSKEPDALSLDDTVAVQIPALPPLRVGWVSDKADPYLELALKSLEQSGSMQLLRYSSQEVKWNDPVSLWILENYLPPAEVQIAQPVWYQTPPKPPSGNGLKPTESGQAPLDTHPIIKGLGLERSKWNASGIHDTISSWRSISIGGNTSLMWVRDPKNESRKFLSAISPAKNLNWVQQTSFPLWAAQIISWLLEPEMRKSQIKVEASGFQWSANQEGSEDQTWKLVTANPEAAINLLSADETRLHFKPADLKDISPSLSATFANFEWHWLLLIVLMVIWAVETWIILREEPES